MGSEKSPDQVDGLKMLALFIHNSRWGEQIRGDERGFVEKAKEFRKIGIEVFAIEMTPSLQNTMHPDAYHSLPIPRLPVIKGPFGDVRSGRAKALLSYVNNLVILTVHVFRAASKVKFDFIYLHNQDIEDVIPGFFLKMLTRKKLILVHHLFQHRDQESVMDGLKRRLRYNFNPLTLIVSTVISAIKRFALMKTDVIVAVSHAVGEDLGKYLNRGDVSITGNGVDIDKFRPIKKQKIYDGVFLGRLHPQKGIDTLLQSWKVFTSNHPKSKLAIIGWENAPYPENYMALSRSLNLEANVDFKGFVEDTMISEIVSASKIFIFPTRYDGFANSVTEALACGVPGVISDIPALRENHQDVCLFVNPGDVEGYASAIAKLISDDALRNKLAKRARKHASSFRWEEVVRIEASRIRSVLDQ